MQDFPLLTLPVMIPDVVEMNSNLEKYKLVVIPVSRASLCY